MVILASLIFCALGGKYFNIVPAFLPLSLYHENLLSYRKYL